uniref:Uncharacterized protein n=1 Tax=Cacopsylla melanoneura TaxID=428564 RepID=A0A8D8TKC8_9HEMI
MKPMVPDERYVSSVDVFINIISTLRAQDGTQLPRLPRFNPPDNLTESLIPAGYSFYRHDCINFISTYIIVYSEYIILLYLIHYLLRRMPLGVCTRQDFIEYL